MNYRIEARQRNDVVSDLPAAWVALGLPEGKCPSAEEVAKRGEEGSPWRLFIEATGEYIFVRRTEKPAHPLNCISSKFGRF
jgi:hypothetical protein